MLTKTNYKNLITNNFEVPKLQDYRRRTVWMMAINDTMAIEAEKCTFVT